MTRRKLLGILVAAGAAVASPSVFSATGGSLRRIRIRGVITRIDYRNMVLALRTRLGRFRVFASARTRILDQRGNPIRFTSLNVRDRVGVAGVRSGRDIKALVIRKL